MTHPEKKPAGIFQTLWLVVASCALLINTCVRSITRSYFGKASRTWVNQRLQIFTRQIMKLWGIQCRVYNPHHIMPKPGVPTIIMCNHSSHFDIPLTFHAFPELALRMLAKKEMSKLPFMGKAMKTAEFPFVDRKNRQQAIRDLKVIHDLLADGVVMWIAPEGTRSTNGQVGPFKKGGFITAIQTKATIIPIGIRGAHQILPARTYQCYLNQSAAVYVGEPIDASQYTLENKEDLIAYTRNAIKALVGDTSP